MIEALVREKQAIKVLADLSELAGRLTRLEMVKGMATSVDLAPFSVLLC